MIAKTLEYRDDHDPLRRAGHRAERQLAHYLKRAFGENPDILVFNNLRVARNGEYAQLDHLVLYRHGLIVIESKSVTGEVSVNEHGEWTRWNARQGRGMPSPVLQGRRQLDLLRALLADHESHLMERRFLGLHQRTLDGIGLTVLVAISDEGRITRKADVPEVAKADQIPDRIRQLIREDERGGFALTPNELQRLHDFLLSRHVPAAERDTPNAPKTTAANSRPAAQFSAPRPSDSPHCQHCASERVSIQYAQGKGYFIQCLQCGGETSVRVKCAKCNAPAKLSKKGREFRVVCKADADHQRPYFTNPA